MPNAYEIFAIVQTLVMVFVAIQIFGIRSGFKAGRMMQKVEDRDGEIQTFAVAVNTKFDQANERMSKLTSDMQSLERRFRDEFVAEKVFLAIIAESRAERERINAELLSIRQEMGRRNYRNQSGGS